MSKPGSRRWAAGILAAALGTLLLAAAAEAQPPVPPLRPGLAVEDLGVPVSRRRLTASSLFKNPATGRLHLLVALDANSGLGGDPPNECVDFDLTAGRARTVATDYNGYQGAGWLLANGKLYIGGNRPADLLEYDPNSGTMRDLGRLTSSSGHGVQCMDVCPEGRLYFGHYGGHVSCYDPATGAIRDFGPMGKADALAAAYVYTIAADGRYVYCGISGTWHLAILDTRTGEKGIRQDLKGGVRRDADGSIWFERTLLMDGEPVAADQVAEARRRAKPRPPNPVMDAARAEQELGLVFDLSDMNPSNLNGGRVTVRWRAKDEKEWRELVHAGVGVVPNAVHALAATPEGKLIGQSASYGPIFEFDPGTRRSRYLGPATGHVYAMRVVGNIAYLAGYRSQFWVYDRAKPFTLLRGTDEYREGADRNPKNLGGPGLYSTMIALGADGRVFVAGNHGRHLRGADMRIYDPASGQIESLRDPLEPYLIGDLCALDGGRRIVWSATVRDKEAVAVKRAAAGELQKLADPDRPGGKTSATDVNLFVYDVPARRIAAVLDVDLPDDGQLMPAGPDSVLWVYGEQGEGNRPQTAIHRVSAVNGRVLASRRVAGRPFTGPMAGDYRGGQREIVLGPDGCGWFCIEKDLVRIHPDGQVEQALALPHGVRMVWNGNDLYLYNGGRQFFGGFAAVWRIKDVLAR